MSTSLPTIPLVAERRLFLGAQGLLADPSRRATRASVRKSIEQLGYVQLDSIRVVERAQHLTLASRLDAYRPEHLSELLEEDRSLFEHWTHCLSAIPTKWFAHWRRRFDSARERILNNRNWQRYIGDRPQEVISQVRRRIKQEGPLRSQDFEEERRSRPSAWHGWKPSKAALEFLWWTGELMVTRRENFHKVYDLTERVLPEHHDLPVPPIEETIEWACHTAIERLIVSTPREIADFWRAVSTEQTEQWCKEAVRAGRLTPVLIPSSSGVKPIRAFALSDWEQRLGKLPDPPERMRMLCPFDPAKIRFDRLFNFEHRLGDLFLPEARRRYGYYVMPILEGDRLVGRVDPKFQREKGVLEMRRLDWQPEVRATRARRRKLEEAATRLAGCIGAERVDWPGLAGPVP